MREGRSVSALVAQRGWRTYASARRRLTRVADSASIASVARPRSSSLDDWHRLTSERHAQYRSEHEPAVGSVGIVCVSNRPERLAPVLEAVDGQRGVSPHFVLVPNGRAWDRESTGGAVRSIARGSVIWDAEDASLGEALNAGTDALDTRFVAKIDDDDHYGPQYLADALRAHRYAGAGIVGKHTYYAAVDALDDLLLRFPGHDHVYSSTLAGGTLVIDRERVGDLRFEDMSLGEDRAFIHACHRLGISTYSADRFSFVQHRGADNTWRLGVDQYLEGCIVVDETAPEHEVDR